VLLFNISMNTLNNGAEEIFLSGTYSPTDIRFPEPGTAALLALAGLTIWGRRKV